MEPFVIALLAHGVIGGVDVLLNHELIARVPSLPHARLEQALHSCREWIFATLFFATAWFGWHGMAALFIGALVLAELVVSVVDMVVEPDTRSLPVPERILHVLLFVNLGIIASLLGQQLLAWAALPTAVMRLDHGWASWALSALGALALGWSVRDGLSAARPRAGPAVKQTADV